MNFVRSLSLEKRVWSAGFLNVLAMALQLIAILSTKDVSGISRSMLLIFIYVQLTFAQAGWRHKEWGQFWGMAGSAAITSTILVLTFVL